MIFIEAVLGQLMARYVEEFTGFKPKIAKEIWGNESEIETELERRFKKLREINPLLKDLNDLALF